MSPIVDLLSMPIDFANELSNELHLLGFDAALHTDPVEFLDKYNPQQYGCVVAYNWSDGRDSLDLIRRLSTHEVPAQVILLVKNPNVSVAAQAAKCGASDVQLVGEPTARLASSIQQVIEFDRVERPKSLAIRDQINRIESLSPGEREVLRFMLAGESNKVIANRLQVSQRTVESRRQKVFIKSETASLAELARLSAKLEKHLNYLRVDSIEGIRGPQSSNKTGTIAS